MATRTKVLLSVQPVAERGGSDHALLRLCRLLGADGWEVHVAMPGISPLAAEFESAGAHLHRVPMRRITRSGGGAYWAAYALLWPVSVLRLLALARRVRPCVVHTNSLHCWYGWPIAKFLRLPHIWHAREIVVQSRLALRLEQKMTARFAWRVVAVSSAVAAQLPRSRSIVLHDVVGPGDGFAPGNAGKWRAGAGIADDAVLVGAAGRIDTWKGFDLLLRAWPEIKLRRPDAELVVAGGPVPGKEAYEAALASEAGKEQSVHWLGPRTDMAELVADLDLFVLPSNEPEPFASSLLEALASGVPVVASDHGGSPEMLAQCAPGTGRLFSPRDPSALARAVVDMLPGPPSSAQARRGRTAVLVGDSDRLAAIFDQAWAEGRAHGQYAS